MTFALALVTVLAQAGTPVRDARPPASAATATIAGIVVNDETPPRPLRRARVTLGDRALAQAWTVTTGDDGSFTFAGAPAGQFSVSASKEAYVPMNYGASRSGRPGAPVIVVAGETRRITIALPRGAVITGTIRDIDGQPAQGIAVTAYERRVISRSGPRYVSRGSPALPTDDRGVYRIYGLPAGEYLIAVEPQMRSRTLLGDRVQTIANGVPDDRELALTQVFHPSAVDDAAATRVTVRAGEERSGVDVRLQYVPLASVSGLAAVGSGWSPAEVAIARVGDVRNQAAQRSTRTDDAGRFSFGGLPPGGYRLLAQSTSAAGGVATAAADVTLEGEDVGNISLALQPVLAISGLLVFRGDTAPPVMGVSRSAPRPPSMTLDTIAAPPLQIDGVRFNIDAGPPGRYRLGGATMGVRTPLGGWWLQSILVRGVELLDAQVDLQQSIDDAVAVFADRASELSGVVTDARGTPVGDVPVVAFAADRSAWFPDSRRIASVQTDQHGRYSILNLPPGDYRVVAASDLEPGEWFDPAVLDRLLPLATSVAIADFEQKILSLSIH